MTLLAESDVESAALAWLKALGWAVKHGDEIAPDSLFTERGDFSQVVLERRLRDALAALNPTLPPEALEDAFRRLTQPAGADLPARNRAFHQMLTEGVTVEYRAADGAIRGAQVQVIDFDHPLNNDWLAVNQFAVVENRHARRPDVVLFVNGLPLVLIELKNPADENADIWKAYQQLHTYRAELPTLFTFNEMLVISDGLEARLGVLDAGREWFKPWRTITGEDFYPPLLPSPAGRGAGGEGLPSPYGRGVGGEGSRVPELQVLLEGVFAPERFLDLLRHFIVFEEDHSRLTKKIAGYHQFHAVRVAVEETLRAAALGQAARDESPGYLARRQPGGQRGDQRVGVIWHTQGSGKSLTMVFYAGRIIREAAMQNPTIVVLTDRNDLDDQLFGTFARCQELLRQPPVQAQSRAHLRQLLDVQAGGVIFTTIQKFLDDETLKVSETFRVSERRNIVVIADEAHRSQYDFIDGFARHMRDALPNASFIAFTGTPIELADKNTRAVFGDYISIYDIQRAVEDGATVPIYYESRLAQLALPEELKPRIDEEFEEVTEGEEIERKERLKTKWAQLEAIVGAPRRLELLAQDIVAHFEQRLETLEGKGMIVCMSRRIAVELYREIVRLRPHWEDPNDERGQIKIVMTGSASDPDDWQPHIRDKRRREALANRFRDPNDPFQLVIVRDMWLTGFDAPSLHTLYLDKPMRAHGLMQAIARVNRVFRDKPGGLVVDYLGLAHELKAALAAYTESGGHGLTALPQDEAVRLMQEKYEVCRDMFHGFDYSLWLTGQPRDRLNLLPAALEHILAQENGKERIVQAARDLSRAFALAVPHPAALRIRDEVAFFQSVQAALTKRTPSEGRPPEDLDHAVRQILAQAITPQGVLDIFTAAGLSRPDLSILSEEFLTEMRGLPHKNLAIEALQRLLKGEINRLRRKNLVQGRAFSELLEQTLRRYQNRAIEAAQVIEELIALAQDMRAAHARGERLGLSEEELAFYDALETNDSAVAVLGDETLRMIARELVQAVRNNVSIDWTLRETVRAQLRVIIKRILRKHGYPPDKQEKATLTVLEQAALLTAEFV
ncbi:MAG: type I restriction endonuclease subunit R [Chloroflexota bacterium]